MKRQTGGGRRPASHWGVRARGLQRPPFKSIGIGAVLGAALVFCACSGSTSGGRPATQAPTAAATSPTAGASAAATASAAAPAPTATPASAAIVPATATPTVTGARAAAAGTATPAGAEQAVMAVIVQANTEQQQALARHDATLMRDTASPSYYRELAQTQQDLERSGATAIKLLGLQWGTVSVQGTSAQATTNETWQTTFNDGSSEQSTDLNVYSLVQQGKGWLIAADDHPNARLNQPGPTNQPAPGGKPGAGSQPGASIQPGTGSSSPPSSTAPSRPAPGASVSSNWAGYVATGGPFTAVGGTWTVPQVSASGTSGSADATWVGIGGVTSDDLIQAGTDATVLGTGQVRYTAWVETLPEPSRPVPLTVSPGDSITVSLTLQGSVSWQISIVDTTTGQRYETTVQYSSSLSSAEWIEEAPSAATSGLRIVPLDNFGQVQFQNGTAVEGNRQVTIAQAQAQPTEMYGRGGQPLAEPSALGSDGESFTVTRVGSSAPATGSGAAQPGRVGR